MAIRQSSLLVADGQALRARLGATAGYMRNLAPYGMWDGHTFGLQPNQTRQSTTWLKTLNSGTFVTTAGATPGLVTVTTNAASLALAQGQESYDGGTTALAQFVPTANTEAFFSGDFKISEITTSGLFIGFAEVDTTILASGLVDVAGMLGFYKPTAGATMVGAVRNSSTSTNTGTIKTWEADTWVNLACRINGVSSVEFFVDGVRTAQTTMTNIPTGNLSFSWAFAANAKTLTYKNFLYYHTGLRS